MVDGGLPIGNGDGGCGGAVDLSKKWAGKIAGIKEVEG